ncbi:hypothetical protein B0H21DRAFT_701490 [Amylocystis lapponica]|nr:hypothetical protein B0H21DRAFT_701490 [Amylocystis lapponica]
MLGRSRAESSMSSSSGSGSFESAEVLPAPRFSPKTPEMVSKTQSDTLIDMMHGSTSSSRAQSLTPSKSRSLEDVSSPAVAVRPSLVASSNIRTYAGKSRSFLVALPAPQLGSISRTNSHSQSLLEDEDILGNSQEDEFEVRESYTDLRARWGVDNSEDDPRPPSPDPASPGDKSKKRGKGKQPEASRPLLPNGMLNDLKSITELRTKGETRRFLDEVGYLFEGLDAKGSIGVRRSSALEIVTKLCDAEFARKTKAADFLGRTWEVLREAGAGNGDKVLDAILIFFAALVARDPRDLADLASKSDFASVLYHMLAVFERENDPLWLISSGLSDAELRKTGISKADKTSLVSLQKSIRKKSGLFEDDITISNRLLLSQALVILPPSLHDPVHLPTLLRSFSLELSPLPFRISAYTSGLSLFPSSSPSDTPSFLHIDNCLRLLDSFLLGRWADNPDAPGTRELASLRKDSLSESLVALCVACDVVSRDTQHPDQHLIALRCMESALRILINLTHDDLPWCQAVLDDRYALLAIVRLVVTSQRQRIGAAAKLGDSEDAEEVDIAAPSLDRLCLALGLLTNLVQVCPAARDRTRDTSLDFSCAGKRACTLECRCASRVSALECLVLVYLQHCKSENELDPVVRGHMAVLFGLLMQGCRENQRVILRALPGASDRGKLNALVEHAREFTLFYVEFTKRVEAVVHSQSRGDEEDEEDVLEGGDGSIERVLRDGKGETVARDVIAFLERLRDA